MTPLHEHMADLQASLDAMRFKGGVRNHFHAGVMAAFASLRASDDPLEQVAAIQSAQEAYVESAHQ